MKNLIIIAIALFAINATAQEKQKDEQKKAMMASKEMHQNMNPEETAQLQTKKMTLQLDLNEKQQEQVYLILLEDAKVRSSKREEFKARKEKTDGEKFSKEERLKMQNERLDHKIEMKKKMKAILNADQYEKLDRMQENRQDSRVQKSEMKKHKD